MEDSANILPVYISVFIMLKTGRNFNTYWGRRIFFEKIPTLTKAFCGFSPYIAQGALND